MFKADDEGFRYFVGRKNYLIKIRGERVRPKEVENAIYEMEGIAEAVVIPVPDDNFSSAIKDFIAPRNGHRLTERNLRTHCKRYLEEFAIPKYFEFR